ncbi:hypothetical protein [Methylobacterium oryzae]|uniref:hypothetical protein n=1 Tax=Methylobacterium oryzae TaxID=334852 RepID=UPI002F35A175
MSGFGFSGFGFGYSRPSPVFVDRTVTTPMRVAGVNERFATDPNSNATRNEAVYYVPKWLGDDYKTLCVEFHAFLISVNSQYNLGNSYTVLELSLIAPNGQQIALTYGGLTSWTVADGAAFQFTDVVWPDQLGYSSSFPKGGKFILKAKIRVTSAGQKIPCHRFLRSYYGAGEAQVLWYNAGATTMSSANAPGLFTYTGTAPDTSQESMLAFSLCGNPIVDKYSKLVVGDSIIEKEQDFNPTDPRGIGYVSRACTDYNNGYANPRPLFLIAISGGDNRFLLSSNKINPYFGLAYTGIDPTGGNDFIQTGGNLTQVQNQVAAVWAKMRAGGVQRILRIKPFPITQSTDSWKTEANQSFQAGYEAALTAFYNWIISKKNDGTINYIAELPNIRAAGNQFKWNSDGVTAFLYTVEGTHPPTFGHIRASLNLRSDLLALEAL